MHKSLAAAALLAIVLTGCSAAEEVEVQGTPDATAAPSTAARLIPPLEKAVDDAKAGHVGADEAVRAMDTLGTLAREELEPVAMAADLLDLRQMEVEIMRGYNGTASEYETVRAVQQYADAVEKTAADYSVLP